MCTFELLDLQLPLLIEDQIDLLEKRAGVQKEVPQAGRGMQRLTPRIIKPWEITGGRCRTGPF
jgi:hypothetical protein